MPDTIFPGCDRIAFRSTRGHGIWRKSRWVEVAIYHCPGARRFILRIEQHSAHDRERTIRTTHRARSLKLILERLDDSQPARALTEQAMLWARDNQEAAHG